MASSGRGGRASSAKPVVTSSAAWVSPFAVAVGTGHDLRGLIAADIVTATLVPRERSSGDGPPAEGCPGFGAWRVRAGCGRRRPAGPGSPRPSINHHLSSEATPGIGRPASGPVLTRRPRRLEPAISRAFGQQAVGGAATPKIRASALDHLKDHECTKILDLHSQGRSGRRKRFLVPSSRAPAAPRGTN
jgi:hypothetical protein